MIKLIQLFIGFLIIIIIVPQTPTENVVLRKLLETGFFTNYTEAKQILQNLTWLLIFSFLIITFYLSFSY
jgi:preprotein translocase subunit SecG